MTRLVALVVRAVMVAATVVSASRQGEREAEIHQLQRELNAAKRATDVDYFARQCDREKREELARCRCDCAEAKP